jgi:hypothetical protein
MSNLDLVEAAGVELCTVLKTQKLLFFEWPRMPEKPTMPDRLYVYCTAAPSNPAVGISLRRPILDEI